VILTVVFLAVLTFFPQINVGFMGALLLLVFGFFFVTVSSRIVGIVGISSNPVSGMTIAALILISIVLTWIGPTGETGMVTSIIIVVIISIYVVIAVSTSQDIKP